VNWNTFFHRRVPPHLWAIVRILLGVFLLLYWYTQAIDAPLFSADGALLPRVHGSHPLLFLLFHPPLWFVQVFFAAVCSLLILFTVGCGMQLCAALLLLCFWYFHLLSQWQFSTSFYRIFAFVMLLFLHPAGDKTFSLSMYLRRGSVFAWEPVSILPQRILAMQMTATYFCVGWQKLFLPGWSGGQVLAQGFSGRWATAFGRWMLAILPPWALDVMLWTTLGIELLIPFGLWIRRVQGWFFVGGFLFHTMVTLTLGIWWFQALVPLYIVFLDPEEIYAACRRLSRGRIR
jgi:hypothetical protein